MTKDKSNLKSLGQKVGQGIKKGAQAVGQAASKGIANLGKGKEAPNAAPSSWQPGSGQAPESSADSPMPSMASVAQSGETQGTEHPSQSVDPKKWHNWKPGQKIDVGWVRGLTVLKVDKYGAQLKAKNGGIYRFVPRQGRGTGGLRKISN